MTKMNAEQYHNKFMRDEMNLTYLVRAVYGDSEEAVEAFNKLDEMNKMQIIFNAGNAVVVVTKRQSKKIKTCLVCSVPHVHNNDFCCAEHKEVYDRRKSKEDICDDQCIHDSKKCPAVESDVSYDPNGRMINCKHFKLADCINCMYGEKDVEGNCELGIKDCHGKDWEPKEKPKLSIHNPPGDHVSDGETK